MSDVFEYEGIKYPDELMWWINARDEIAADMPDGAWEAMCKEGAIDYNEEYGTTYDEHDAWLAWMKWSAAQRDALKGEGDE